MVFTITVNASDEFEISPMFIALKTHTNNLDIEDNIATCIGSAMCLNSHSVQLTLYLERYTGNGWTTVRRWDGDKDMYSYVNETITVSSGYNYRVKSIATVYDKNNKVVEAPFLYSNLVIN
jgi:hypothetical protein